MSYSSASGFGRLALAATTVMAIALSGLVVLGSPQAASAATGTITGSVYRDYNANGLMDTTVTAGSGIAVDTGLTGVTVTAYDANNTAVGSTVVSASDGSYTLTATNAITSQLRVEFTTLPAGLEETPVFSTGGARTGSSVQFVSIGAANVNFGAGVPEDYSQDNPPVITAIQYAGLPNSTAAASPAIVGQAYDTNVPSGSTSTGPGAFTGRTTLATFSQVGAVWGTAYRAPQNDLLVAATYKRHSGLGSLGLGGIYRVTEVVTNSQISTTGTTVDPWLDVTAAPLNINVGTALSNAARGITAGNVEARDPDAFAQAGKIGIGGMAVSADGNLLYFVNLFDKSLYTLNISNLASPSIVAVTPLGLAAGERPWALTLHAGQAYVGYVTSGETLVGGIETANPGISAATAGLTANVIRAALPLTGASTFSPVLTGGDLGYAKGDVYANQLAPQSQRWNTWADTWTWAGGSVGVQSGTSGWHIYPSPVLTALYFDENNFMTLGFADRTGIQGGNRNHSSDPTGTRHYETGSSGDILLAAPNGAGTSWALEVDGVAGSRSSGTAARLTNSEGPGTGEFYGDSLNQNLGNTHHEVVLGALTGVRGTHEVVSTQYDPLGGIRLAGLGWLSTQTGDAVGGYEETADGGASTTPANAATFQKGGGMASVQALADEAPLEIGNRVWFDADQDGIQDADEPALPGVTVELRQGATVIGTMVTGADGSYYFSSDPDSPFHAPGFEPNGGSYTITFVKPAGNVPFVGADATTFGTVAWSSLTPTTANAGGDTVDSDINPAGSVSYVAGGAGETDHSIDAGFTASSSFTVSKAISPTGGTPAVGQTFTILATAVDFRGNPYVLAESPFVLAGGATSSVVTVPVGTQVTVTEANGGQFRSNSVSPAGPTLITSGTPVDFTVTNELFEPGSFTISKSVTGSAAGSVSPSQSFTVTYTYPGQGAPETLTVTNGGTSAPSSPIPFGTTVTLSEIAPIGAPADVAWSTPTWAELAGDGVVTDNGDGTASITIDDDATLSVGLTNPTTSVAGGFSVTKVIGPDAAASVPSTFPFTVQYRLLPAGAWTDLVVTPGSPTATVTGLPAGATVEIREVAPGAAAPDVQWGTPVFSGNVTTVAGVTTFTVPTSSTEPITLTNPTTRLYGSFTLLKDVTGPVANSVAAGHDFTINYSYVGMPGSGIITIEDGQLFTSEDIPLGTSVTITEVTPTGGLPAGASYGTPVLHIGSTTIANGSVIDITDATPIAITLENPTIAAAAIAVLAHNGTDSLPPLYAGFLLTLLGLLLLITVARLRRRAA